MNYKEPFRGLGQAVLSLGALFPAARPIFWYSIFPGWQIRGIGVPWRAAVFALGWDGVLTTGHWPVPGIYLLRLEVASDRGDEALQRVISLAY